MGEVKGQSVYQGRDYVTLVSFPLPCSSEGGLGPLPWGLAGRSSPSAPFLGLLGAHATAAAKVLPRSENVCEFVLDGYSHCTVGSLREGPWLCSLLGLQHAAQRSGVGGAQ